MNPALDTIPLGFQPASLLALNIILGLLMFGVALDLKLADFRSVARSPKAPLVGFATQMLLLPPASFVLIQILQPIPSVALGMLLIAACPGGNVSNFLVWMARGNAALSVCMTVMTSVAAIVMTPFNLTFWGSIDPATSALLADIAVDPVAMLTTILLILGLPLIAGMFVRSRFPELSALVQRPLRLIGGLTFLGFVVSAFYRGRDNLGADALPVLLMVIAHNALALGLGYTAARLARLTPRDRRAVTLEVGIQNSGLGFALIFNFFAGLGGMMIVAAWWGCWHLVGGLTLATIWSRLRPACPAGASATAGRV